MTIPFTPEEMARSISAAKDQKARVRALSRLMYITKRELLDYAFPERVEARRKSRHEAVNRWRKKKRAEAKAARLAQEGVNR